MKPKFKTLLLSLIFLFLLTLCGFKELKVNAAINTSDNLIVDGAQIRTVDAGLRFVGNVKKYDNTNVSSYGICLAFGDAKANDSFVLNGTVNGKKVINGEVSKTTDGIFTVTVINIPESSYTQNISARLYVKDGTNTVYSTSVITRSLAQGVINAKARGHNEPKINEIFSLLQTNYLIREKNTNVEGTQIKEIIEKDRTHLYRDFINDWNELFNTSIINFTANGFYNEAKSNNMNNISDSKLYKFFNTDRLKSKWIWLIEFLRDYNTYIVHTVNQANAILGDGTYQDKKLYYLDHTCYSIYNFFNATHEVGGYTSVDFTNDNNYTITSSLCNTPINLDNYDLICKEEEHKIIYELNNGSFNYLSKDEYVIAFLKDFYKFVKPTEDINKFIYGDSQNKFLGTWKNYIGGSVGEVNKLLYNNDLTLDNDEYFFNSKEYKLKWANLGEWVKNQNDRFAGRDYLYGALDFYRYIINDPDQYINIYGDNFYKYPTLNEPTTLTFKYQNTSVKLDKPLSDKFLGWYLNSDLTGNPVTEIPAYTSKDFKVFAKWASDEVVLEDLVYDNVPVKYRNSNRVVQIPNHYIQKDTQLRAVWVSSLVDDFTPSPNKDTMIKRLTEVLDFMDSLNMNTIIFHIRTMNNAFYKTKLAPIPSNYGTYSSFETWDYLTWFIGECHKRGLEFHAWLNPYRIKSYGYASNATAADVAKDYANYPDNPAHKPENILMTYRSDGTHGAILNPAKTEVQDYIVNVCLEVMQNYDIDAIHFDDYFYAQMSEDINLINEPDQQDYINYINSNPDKGFSANSKSDKANWRRMNVDNFIYKLSKSMREFNKTNKKAVQLGIAPTGIYRNGNGSVDSGSNTGGQEHYSSYLFCDTKKWVQENLIDYILPQSYWAFTHTVAGYADVMDWWNEVVRDTNVNLYSGIGLYMSEEPNTNYSWGRQGYEVSNQILYTTKLDNVKGVSFFAYKQLKKFLNNSNSVSYPGLMRIKNNYWTTKIPTPATFADTFLAN